MKLTVGTKFPYILLLLVMSVVPSYGGTLESLMNEGWEIKPLTSAAGSLSPSVIRAIVEDPSALFDPAEAYKSGVDGERVSLVWSSTSKSGAMRIDRVEEKRYDSQSRVSQRFWESDGIKYSTSYFYDFNGLAEVKNLRLDTNKIDYMVTYEFEGNTIISRDIAGKVRWVALWGGTDESYRVEQYQNKKLFASFDIKLSQVGNIRRIDRHWYLGKGIDSGYEFDINELGMVEAMRTLGGVPMVVQSERRYTYQGRLLVSATVRTLKSTSSVRFESHDGEGNWQVQYFLDSTGNVTGKVQRTISSP